MVGQKQVPLFGHVETARGVGQAHLPVGESRHASGRRGAPRCSSLRQTPSVFRFPETGWSTLCLRFTNCPTVTKQRAKVRCLRLSTSFDQNAAAYFLFLTSCFFRVPRFGRMDAPAFVAGVTGRRESGNHHHGRRKGRQILLEGAGTAG